MKLGGCSREEVEGAIRGNTSDADTKPSESNLKLNLDPTITMIHRVVQLEGHQHVIMSILQYL